MADNKISFARGLSTNLPALRDSDTFYLTLDTHQIYLGESEYTKGTKVLSAAPTTATVGEKDVLYTYGGSLYLCTDITGGEYTYVEVANINHAEGTVTEVAVGDGLETDSGAAIASTGTISHSIPSGATVVSDPTSDASLDFGDSFTIQGVSTDKFGHVTAASTHTITLPTETAVDVENATGTPQTLSSGSTFAAVTGVEVGEADQAIKQTTTVFTLPEAITDTTYTFATSVSTDGAITVTPSSGSSYDVVIKGYADLAKKTDLTAIFRFKGTKATVADLPVDSSAKVGDVWHVTADDSEYVCIAEADTTSVPATDAQWEELGGVVDLSAYALSADVIQRVTSAEGEVPKFKADGTVESTGFTLGCSVPSTAVFTDTTYAPATTAEAGLMSAADKIKLDEVDTAGEENVIESISVNGTTLTVDANKDVAIALTDFGITATAAQLNDIEDKLDLTDGGVVAGATTFSSSIDAAGGVVGNVTGDLTGTASMATADASGNVITTTYATKSEITTALAWQDFT